MSIKSLLQNWKTTSAGLTMIVGSTIHLVWMVAHHTANENTWQGWAVAIIGGAGLLLAGDASQSKQVEKPTEKESK